MGNKLLRPAGTWFVPKSESTVQRKWSGIAATGRRVEVIKRGTPPTAENVVKCVKCQAVVNPGMTHQARVYTGNITITVDKARLISLNPTAQYEEYTEKLKLPKFSTGHVCDVCCADFGHTTIEHRDGSTETVPNVTTLPRAIGMKPRDENIGFTRRGFSKNMRVRGNTGARVKPDTYYTGRE